ncbi:MAG TPA: hypothetical protein VIL74_16135 [Pyrinomonadaceae bacterium]|jgi:hypothetical protein
MSEIKQIEPANWEQFLREFADRNNNRRARFDVYRSDGTTEDEGEEAHLEDVRLKTDGNSKTVEIVRIDRSHRNTGKTHDTITNVRGVAVQYDTDGSEDALEITDDENTLISLRFESKVDGVS